MILIAVCILSFLLRIAVLDQSFWLDESIGVLAAKNQTWLNLLTQWPKGDNHPPLYYLLLKGWGSSFSYSETSVRFLSIIFGVLTVFFVYKIAQLFIKDAKKKNFFPLLVSLLVATSPLHIYYSQEARMYVAAGALASGAIYFFLKTLKDNNFWNWLGFSIFITLLVFTDYLPVFLLPVFWIYGFILIRDKKWWSRFIFSHLLLLISGIFWLPIFLIQSAGGKAFLEALPAWRLVAGGANLKQLALVWNKFVLGRITFYNEVFYYSLLGICSLPFIATLVLSLKRYKEAVLFWFWLIIPLIFTFVFSFFIPAFIYFRFIFVLPAFYFVLVWGVQNLKNKWKNLLSVTLVLINLLGYSFYVFNPNHHRENWREAVAFVETYTLENSIVVFANSEPFAPYQWYSTGKVPAKGLLGSIKIDKAETVNLIRETIEEKENVIYFTYLSALMDPDGVIEETMFDLGFSIQKEETFNGVGKIIYLTKLK